jgi:hypothetical protein
MTTQTNDMMSECKPTLQMYCSLFVRIDLLTKERDEARRERDENELLKSTVTDCRIEIERLTAERDTARREICVNATAEPYREMCGNGILLPRDAARERGWDCFKEEENGKE